MSCEGALEVADAFELRCVDEFPECPEDDGAALGIVAGLRVARGGMGERRDRALGRSVGAGDGLRVLLRKAAASSSTGEDDSE